MLFDNQEAFNKVAAETQSQGQLKALFATLAEGLGLDRARFEADIASEPVMLDVKESQRHGILHQVWSTPTFVVNGTEVPSLGSSTTLEDWTKYISSLLG